MTRGNSRKESVEKNKDSLSPLKRFAAKKQLEAASTVPMDADNRGDAPANEIGLYQLDWTLGEFAHGSDAYRQVLDTLAPKDSGLAFDREHFLNLLAFSLSLSLQEKKRVLAELGVGLSQFQVDELIDTFEEERREFQQVLTEERAQREILPMYMNALWDWSKVLLGQFSAHFLAKAVLDVLRDSYTIIPAFFKRDANFWKVLGDYFILWGLDNDEAFKELIDRGLRASQAEGGDRLFQLDLIDCAYRTDLYSLSSPRPYIERRVKLLQTCAFTSLPDTAPNFIVCRALLLGFTEDYFRLGQTIEAGNAIAKAEAILEAVSGEVRDSDEFRQIEVLLATCRLVLEAFSTNPDMENVAALLKQVARSTAHLVSNKTICSLLLMRQGDLCCDLLAKRIEDNKSNAPGTLLAAAELLIFSQVTANENASLYAKARFSDYLQKGLKNLGSKHRKKDLAVLRETYIATMVFVWLGDGTLEEREDILRLWRSVSGQGFHEAMRSDKESKQKADWPGSNYWLIRTLEQRLDGMAPDMKVLISSIKEYWQLFYLLTVLLGLSANPDIRKKCQDMGRALINSSERRLFGVPLQDKITRFFQPFTDGPHYAGGSVHQTQQWRGQLSYEALFT